MFANIANLEPYQCLLFIQNDTQQIIYKEESNYYLQQLLHFLQIEEQIIYSPNGKPLFADSYLHFSVSHSGNIWVACLAKFPIGIDVEVFSNAHLIKTIDPILGIESLENWCAAEAIIKCIDATLDDIGHIKEIVPLENYTLYEGNFYTKLLPTHLAYTGFVASHFQNLDCKLFENIFTNTIIAS